jgi:hypothetical protein
VPRPCRALLPVTTSVSSCRGVSRPCSRRNIICSVASN